MTSNIDWNEKLNNLLNPNELLDNVLQTSYDICKKHVPIRNPISQKHNIPRVRRLLMKRRSRINKRLLNMTSISRKDKLTKELIQIEMKLQESRKNSTIYEEQKAIKSIKKNSKYFFTYAKKFSKVRQGVGPLKSNNEYIYDNNKIAELLSKQFTSVFTEKSNPSLSKEDIFPNELNYDLSDIELNDDIFLHALDELSPTAAPGPDGFPAILLLKCKVIYSKILHKMWRICLDNEETPIQLKKPNVVPIHKGGEKTKPENYRPISLTSHIVSV